MLVLTKPLFLKGGWTQVIILWGFDIFLIFANFLRLLVLSRLATHGATRIYHIHYQYSCFVSLVVNKKFGKVSKVLKIFCPWLSANISFPFYVFIKRFNSPKQSYSCCNLLFLKKRPGAIVKVFQYRICTSMKSWEKKLSSKRKFSTFLKLSCSNFRFKLCFIVTRNV